ncbi:efflux RND transporter periplasmic adaptor subunit [Hydrogenobacter hydrogenophilus]|uniref:Membrane fusion protein, multidrug efflux system n=1 Tax=Hydrogenobacter hydrogenophilus TaxID=35835 RepID=A0A285NYL1_9AQUI|nr:efflux RND transporter periplasmic adaptor subunit [Hydrogenobacter hydrogenophilus]SNZ12986.1 membrane fusion protein, multidrug efflux system [Hydrogenobacter hydrogenophilus]
MGMVRWFLLIALFLLGSCSREEKVQGQKKEESIPISIYYVKPQEIEVFYTTNGYFEGIRDVILRPEVSGRVLELLVDEGSFVKKGQPLLRIDPTDYQNALNQIKANLMQAKANYENQKAIYERRKFLYEQNLIAREEFENASTQLKVYQDQISAIEAQLRNAQTQLYRTVLRAPFSGYIAQKFINVGDYITPQSQAFRIVTLDPIKVVFQVPQEIISSVKMGSEVYLDVEGIGSYKGKVIFLSPSADANRLITVKALVKNQDGKIKPNMYAKVKIPTSSTVAFKVPEMAVVLIGNEKAVWKVEGNRVSPVKVQILKQEEGFVYVKGDLKEGDQVAVENAYLLNQTSKVKVK